ncbi:NAD-dependent succinate-semialdehyde dehydrogenase [Spirabiliibacterium falconis]|uniref:NAD-dependent succinate-semialdehyde dehydrogenase n=1 Tax=Spirabiliibacterium falconis TaxID=572023 RepID=UPI001AACD26E|nr:NAD-dependent succinate-semialdehyde dehydrogenase [Spirabiliibacterium falconis]MBE2895141.1 NAD-dependent succinate-semialdehyde dehydrogenase [Spirabiliibacterium falconis]
MTLSQLPLVKTDSYINGKFMTSNSGARFAVYNPATGDEIAQVSDCNELDAESAIASAKAAQQSWAALPAKVRSDYLMAWHDLIMTHQQTLAEILSLEQGKPLKESLGEIAYGASFIKWFAEEGKRAYGEIIPQDKSDRRILVLKQPIGVVAAITPWNFPNAMITRKAAPALAAGCTMVLKPAPETPLSALALAELAQQAGIPAGVFNVLPTTQAERVGKILSEHPDVQKLTFTGSTRVGKMLMAQCASSVKKVALELGGNAPAIVFNDADLDNAVEGVIASKFRNAGQTCVCTNRIYVQRGILPAFTQKLVEKVRLLRIGNAFSDNTDIGPLINQSAVEKVESHIQDALAKGATLHCGGKRHALGQTFFEPTVLSGVTQAMAVAKEETFAPLAPIFAFDEEKEVIAMANDTEFGLAAYLFTQDYSRIWRASEALEYGLVGVNEGLVSTEIAPFGGIKQSGIGREGARQGLEEFMELKYICVKI